MPFLRNGYAVFPEYARMAKAAGAVYKLNKMVLVNCEVFEQFLETFRI